MPDAIATASQVFAAWQEATRRGNDRAATDEAAEPFIMEADRLARRLAEGRSIFGQPASAAELHMKAQVARHEIAANDTGLAAALLDSIICDLGNLVDSAGKHAYLR